MPQTHFCTYKQAQPSYAICAPTPCTHYPHPTPKNNQHWLTWQFLNEKHVSNFSVVMCGFCAFPTQGLPPPNIWVPWWHYGLSSLWDISSSSSSRQQQQHFGTGGLNLIRALFAFCGCWWHAELSEGHFWWWPSLVRSSWEGGRTGRKNSGFPFWFLLGHLHHKGEGAVTQ